MSYSYLAFIALGVALIFPGPKPEKATEAAEEIILNEDFTQQPNVMEAEKDEYRLNFTEVHFTVPAEDPKPTFKQCFYSKQFWLIYAMCCLSILYGFYTLDVYKNFGETKPVLNHDLYLTEVGSIAGVFGSLRFVWSAALDRYSYRKVYGSLLVL